MTNQTLLSLNRGYENLQKENERLNERVKKLEKEIESHAPEGRNYTNQQYIELLQENQYFKRKLSRMLQRYRNEAQAYGDRYAGTYNFDRYDEVRDFVDLLEQVLEVKP